VNSLRSPSWVRPASELDVPAILAIYNAAVENSTGTFDTEPRTLEERLGWFRSHDVRHPVVVADSEANVVGWGAIGEWSPRRAYDATGEVSTYVAESHRGRGVGSAILAALVVRATELDFHVLLARIAEGNAASLRMHEHAGFVSVGVMREVGSKFGRRLDVHLLQWMAPVAAGKDR
jgi:L-amino acid N-acyltransferase YncA